MTEFDPMGFDPTGFDPTGFDPAGQCVVVTGAAGGIGEALARALAERGAYVVVADLNAVGVDAVVAAIEAAGGRAIAAPGDAATEAGIAALIARAEAACGPIGAWFANAGVDRGRGIAATDDEWASSLEVNLMAHVRAARALVPGWLESGGGRFVVTASAAGLLSALGAPAYTVSKHGAVAFAEWLSATYRHRGIVVQALCPEWVQTDMLDGIGAVHALMSPAEVLTPESVAATAVAALAGDEFLILPHAQVADYYAVRATATDRWLAGMNRIQQTIDRSS